ncbi:bifunctional proline dehydrogenase/L-glutamate gamma-semialdehyde dehydrogenase, partial [Patescibacteria group bacterium]|nr:bifunctional proline dehydrogenase/L-glutamate gamma-semialdehyde dehydrogenase [Patescibacteria group bacterium]
MKDTKSESLFVQDALELIDSVKNKPFNSEELINKSLELAVLIVSEAKRIQTPAEKKEEEYIVDYIKTLKDKAFIINLLDQSLRSSSFKRTADQIAYLLAQLGTPNNFPLLSKIKLFLVKIFNPQFSKLFVGLVNKTLLKETFHIFAPAETALLNKYLDNLKEKKITANLYRFKKRAKTTQEVEKYLKSYLKLIEKENVEYISIKLEDLSNNINLLAWDIIADEIAEKLRILFRAILNNPLPSKKYKIIHLDIEDYKLFDFSIFIFKKILKEEEFLKLTCGITLLAYFPNSYLALEDLTQWAKERVKKGGEPIKIRIAKGGDLPKEQVFASINAWPSPTFATRAETDANFKKLLNFSLTQENVKAVQIGVATLNIFDISYSLLLSSANNVENSVFYEFLKGKTEHISNALQKFSENDLIIYCPIIKKDDYVYSINYIIRRLDDATNNENYINNLPKIIPKTIYWEEQVSNFLQSCSEITTVSSLPNLKQNRLSPSKKVNINAPFENDQTTDFTNKENRLWMKNIIEKWQNFKPENICPSIGGKEICNNFDGEIYSPSNPKEALYKFCYATKEQIEKAISTAKKNESSWKKVPIEEKISLFANLAQKFKEKRDLLIGTLMLDTGKTFAEACTEVSEAIDAIEYHRKQVLKLLNFTDIEWTTKGTILITPPWGYPFTIITETIVGALLTGNVVIVKPQLRVIFSCWQIVNLMWENGISKEILQFVPCTNKDFQSLLLTDPRINLVILSTTAEKAKKYIL